jgi:predicted amidohydrolase
MKLIVSAVQMEIESLDFETNLKKAGEYAREAAESSGCHFLCFPELFLTGPLDRSSLGLAQKIPGPFTDALCELAARYGMHIIAGSMAEEDGGAYYNTSVLIDDAGAIIGKYRKMHLWCGEKILTTPGREPGLFDTKWGKVGIEICWDMAFPELSKRLALDGARILFCPTLWTHDDRYSYFEGLPDCKALKAKIPDVDTERTYIDTCAASRAIENSVAVVLANGCGKTRIVDNVHNLVGRSQIDLPFYGIWKALAAEERILTGEIDMDLLDLAEEAYRTRIDSVLAGA